MISKMSVVHLDSVSIPDAERNSAGDTNGPLAGIAGQGIVMPAHPEVIGGGASVNGVAGVTTAGGRLKKLVNLLPRGAGVLRGITAGQGMGTGDQKIVDPSRMRKNQFEVVVDQRAGIKELKCSRGAK